MSALAHVCDDLAAEHEAFDAVLAVLAQADWARPTPADGWDVRDQVSHLAFFDAAAHRAVTDPEAFVADRPADHTGLAALLQRATAWGRSLAPVALLDEWRVVRAAMVDAFRRTPPSERVPWYGPAMSPTSFATARLMETWAHGQDVVDALDVERPATDRLRHVAHLGVLALGNSFRVRGLEPPRAQVRVELRSPGGQVLWTWGDADACDRVAGDAHEFALVVTQRRHVADTALQVAGPVARRWMELAQAFAGPPGRGRSPGQFARPVRLDHQEVQ